MRRIFDFIEALFIVVVVVGGLGSAMICGAAYLTHIITGSYQ